MNNRAVMLSATAAILAVVFVQSYVSSIENEAKKKFGTEVMVVTAKQDIKEMSTITETMLELKPVPKKFLEPAAVFIEKNSTEKTTDSNIIRLVSGSVAMVPIKKGEQISFSKITEVGIRTGLSPQIAPGKRAVSIAVNELSGVSKLLKPGDRVDIIYTGELGSGKENKISKTVLQDVIVLSIGRVVANNTPRIIESDAFGGKQKIRNLSEDFSFTSVALELDPYQAQMVTLLSNTADSSLTLTLRNNDDTERTNVSAVGFKEVLGGDLIRVIPNRR
jgi:pilus assembly protein CpaB